MNPWPFVIGAYVICLIGTAAITWLSYWEMKRAEAAAAGLGRRET